MGMNALLLLLAVTSTLVLRTGDRIVAEGLPREEGGVVVFRSAGVLYSLPASEVVTIEKNDESGDDASRVRKLAVSPEERKRLIEELERNHSGTAVPQPPVIERAVPRAATRTEIAEQKREEQQWRREARAHEESVRRAQEELALIEARVEELKTQIHSFLSLGYKPSQFTYQTSRLAQTEEMLPRARLQVERARRAYDEFREDARRQGVLPGWLR